MRVFGKAEGGGRRRGVRAKMPLVGTLSTAANAYRVGLINLSKKGARLCAPDLPVAGEEVVFRADKVRSIGRVVWSRGGQCGVVFDRGMSPDEVGRLRDEADYWKLNASG